MLTTKSRLLETEVILILISLVTLLIVCTLSDPQLLCAIIVFGQGHFFITYLYQYKYKKIDKKYVSIFMILSLLVFPLVYNLYYENHQFINYFILFVGTLFVFHYYNDELFIQLGINADKKLLAIIPIILSYFTVFSVILFGVDYHKLIPLIIISLTLFALYIYKTFKATKNRSASILLFTTFNVIAPIFLSINSIASLEQVFGYIIIFHYIRWYIYYIQRYSIDEKNYTEYTKSVFRINLFVLSLFLIYIATSGYVLFLFLFNPLFFYGWTVLHIMMSLRKDSFNSYRLW